MKKSVRWILLAPFLAYGCFTYKGCQLFPKTFHSVQEAETRLNTVECESLYDSLSLANPREIRKAAFYSCDKKFGYLLITLKDRRILYRNLPIQYWKNLRKARSFEGYYQQNIEHRFPVYLEEKQPVVPKPI